MLFPLGTAGYIVSLWQEKWMHQPKAIRMFKTARAYCEKNYPDELDWANSISPETFMNLRSKRFLSEYCWVIYASGFKVSTVETIFPSLRAAFKDFELAALARMKSVKPHSLFSIMNARRVLFLRVAN
jgi:3-methyladenine DNA glycosylase Tag